MLNVACARSKPTQCEPIRQVKAALDFKPADDGTFWWVVMGVDVSVSCALTKRDSCGCRSQESEVRNQPG